MSDSALPEDGIEATEMARGTVGPEPPAGMLAEAWLAQYSQPLTWADLLAWLGEAG
jgi:hypothetical protein